MIEEVLDLLCILKIKEGLFMNTLKYGSVAVGAPNSIKRKIAEIRDCVYHITDKDHSYLELRKLSNEILSHITRLDNLFS